MLKNAFILNSERTLNLLELTGIILMLVMASAFQHMLNELPCPLCLLQRFGFLLASFGLLLNLRFGFHPSHYALIILSTLFTAFVALRQVASHVIPGTGSYGEPFLGLHLYTWTFIAAMLMVIGTTIMFAVDSQYSRRDHALCKQWLLNAVFAVITLLTLTNIFDIWSICGLNACPDNPLHYVWDSKAN